MGPTIFVDIDHVISDARWRDPMIGVNSWDEYHEAMTKDPPVMEMVMLVRAIQRGLPDVEVIGLSARPEKWRAITSDWFIINKVPLTKVLLRPENDFEPAHKSKVAMALAYFGSEEAMLRNLMLVIDDNQQVIAAFANLGISTAYFQIGSRDRGR